MKNDNVLMLTYPGWDSPDGRRSPIARDVLRLPPNPILRQLMEGRPIVLTLSKEDAQIADPVAKFLKEENEEDLKAVEEARAEGKRLKAVLRQQHEMMRKRLQLQVAAAARRAAEAKRKKQEDQKDAVRAQRDLARQAKEEAARQELRVLYKEMVTGVTGRARLQKAFNAELTAISDKIETTTPTDDLEKEVRVLLMRIRQDVAPYDRAVAAWKPALDAVERRIGFVATSRDKQNFTETMAALKAFIWLDPFDKDGLGNSQFESLTLRQRFTELSDTVERVVEGEEKIRRKEALFQEVRDTFLDKLGRNALSDKKYEALSDRKKALIRPVRQNLPLPNTAAYKWEKKPHEYRQGQSGNAPHLTNKATCKSEYRLWEANTNGKLVLGGQRMTSVGAPNSDTMLFFDIDHKNVNEYRYGLVTRLPLHRDKNAPKQPVYPDTFPATVPAVVLP
jgi:hypothetical protein